MAKKPTAADAELILKLYDLRREAEMRKARNWWVTTFWPESVDDFMAVSAAAGTQENNWFRQVSGYWSMAASLVVHGALNADLFLEPSFSGEMFVLFAKVRPFLPELRARTKNPQMYSAIETAISSSKRGRDFLKYMETNLANRKAMFKAAAKAS
jgi:hypothetical protein